MSAEDVCRLCLTKDKLVWAFNKRFEEDIIHRIVISTGVEIKITDVVSQNVCEDCHFTVIKMYNFRIQALKNDRFLKEALKNEESNQSTPVVQIKQEKIDESEETNKPLPIHPTVQEVYDLYPNIKIMRMCINSDLKPFVVMPLGKVENYFKERNLNFEEHCRLAMKPKATARKRTLASPRAAYVSPPCSINGQIVQQEQDDPEDGIVRPIKIKIIPKTSVEKISHVTKDILKIIENESKVHETEDMEPCHKKMKYSDTRAPSVEENKVTDGIQPLSFVTNISMPLYTCDICDSIQENPKDLKKHRYKHLRCQFCKSTFPSLEDKSKHLDECLIKSAMNNIPCIELPKVDTVADIVKKFPTAFADLSPTADNSIDFHKVQIESVTGCVESSSKPVEHTTTQTVADVIEILSDDDDIPADSTKSKDHTSVKMPKPITAIKPQVKIKDDPFKDFVVTKSNEIQTLTNLLKYSESLHMSATEKDVQTDPPAQQGVEVDESGQTALLTNLQHHLHVFKVPVVIKEGPFSVSYSHTTNKPKTKKMEMWNDLVTIDIEKKTLTTPIKHSTTYGDSSPATEKGKLSLSITTVVSTPLIDKEQMGKRNELVAINTKENNQATTANHSTTDNKSSPTSRDVKSSLPSLATVSTPLVGKDSCVNENTPCPSVSIMNKPQTKKLDTTVNQSTADGKYSPEVTESLRTPVSTPIINKEDSVNQGTSRNLASTVNEVVRKTKELRINLIAKRITENTQAKTAKYSKSDVVLPPVTKGAKSLLTTPKTVSTSIIDMESSTNEDTTRPPVCVLNKLETDVGTSAASELAKSSSPTPTSIVAKRSCVNEDTSRLAVSKDNTMSAAFKVSCDENCKHLSTFEIEATVTAENPINSTHSHISAVGPSAVSTFPSLRTASQSYTKHVVESPVNQATTASPSRVKNALTWKPPPVVKSPPNITRPKSAEDTYSVLDETGNLPVANLTPTTSKDISTGKSLVKPSVFSPPTSASLVILPNTSVYDIPNTSTQKCRTSAKSPLTFRIPQSYKEQSQLHSNSNGSFNGTRYNYNLSRHHPQTTISGYTSKFDNRSSQRSSSTTTFIANNNRTTSNTPNNMMQQSINTEVMVPSATPRSCQDNNLYLSSSTFTAGPSNVPLMVAVDKSNDFVDAQRYFSPQPAHLQHPTSINGASVSYATVQPNNTQYNPVRNTVASRSSLSTHTWKATGQPPTYSAALVSLANNYRPYRTVQKISGRGNPFSNSTNGITLPQHSSNTQTKPVNPPSITSTVIVSPPKTCQTSSLSTSSQFTACSITTPQFGNIRVKNMQELT